ncbi:hypothetical protein VNI00_010169 [Paramarasmius palmivorus]|uniref:Uncharacterized protein n=1 Tax=Paramarasmius palmivorus TaxID=297713 RepID=A0AAW0CMI6_9AGAR
MPTQSKLSDLLFAPPDGRLKYQREDFQVVCRSTPLPFNELPCYLADQTFFDSIRPPWIWCGWRIGEKALFNLVETHYPKRVRISGGRTLITPTVFQLPKILFEELQIPDNAKHLIRIVDAANSEGQVDMALVIGNNYEGIIPPETGYIDRIKNMLFEGRDPEWYLGPNNWSWAPAKARQLVLKSIPDISEPRMVLIPASS